MLIYLQLLDDPAQRCQFEQLYLEYRGLMYRMAHRIVRNEQDAEDAVHQAFLSILKNFDKISSLECPQTRSYIVIIVEHKALDILRKRRELSLDEGEALPGLEVPPPGDHGLADAMAALPARCRSAVRQGWPCRWASCR